MPIIKLNKVRIVYPNLFEPRAVMDSEPKYSATFLFAPDHKAHAAVKAAIEEAAKAKWGEKAPAVLKAVRAAGKTCLRNGDDKDVEGFEGNMYISTSNKKRPKVVDADGDTPLVAADGKPYGGCYVNAYVDVYALDMPGVGKGIWGSLQAVQFHSDGEAMGGGSAGNLSFDAVEEDDEEDLV
ncbi:MAG: hypothetical protein CGW95_06530 [Phenylobacterium zucineum]|nr:MAG: hypothetical protein CGW95_06530 [Phenylobacterium zucineum]